MIVRCHTGYLKVRGNQARLVNTGGVAVGVGQMFCVATIVGVLVGAGVAVSFPHRTGGLNG